MEGYKRTARRRNYEGVTDGVSQTLRGETEERREEGSRQRVRKRCCFTRGRTRSPIPGTWIILPLNPMGLQPILVSIFWTALIPLQRRRLGSRSREDLMTEAKHSETETWLVHLCWMLEVSHGAERRTRGGKSIMFFWLSNFWVEPFADPINGKSKNHFFYGTNLWRFCQNKKREFTQCNFALVKFVLSVISHKALPTQMTVWMRGPFTPPRLCLRLI